MLHIMRSFVDLKYGMKRVYEAEDESDKRAGFNRTLGFDRRERAHHHVPHLAKSGSSVRTPVNNFEK